MVSTARCSPPIGERFTICVGPFPDCASVLDIKKPRAPPTVFDSLQRFTRAYSHAFSKDFKVEESAV